MASGKQDCRGGNIQNLSKNGQRYLMKLLAVTKLTVQQFKIFQIKKPLDESCNVTLTLEGVSRAIVIVEGDDDAKTFKWQVADS